MLIRAVDPRKLIPDITRDLGNGHGILPEQVLTRTVRLSSHLAHSARSPWAVISDTFTISGVQPFKD